MLKKCNVYPQVFNSTEYVDSKLFKTILSNVKDREKAKSIYEAYHSKDFKDLFGDWNIYQSVKFNKLTEEQNAVFQSVYNGNIEQLESTLDLNNLNELYEPIYGLTESQEIKQKGHINIKSENNLKIVADRLNISFEHLKAYISQNNSVYFQEENKELNNSVIPVKGGNTLGVIYGIKQEETNRNDNRSLNSIVLGDEFQNDEILLVNNLISGLVLNDLDTLRNLMKSKTGKKKTEAISTYMQVEEINNFIVEKINNFKNQIVKELTDIKDKVEFNKSFYENKIDTINKTYDRLISEFTRTERGSHSFLYKAVLAHLDKYYNINIADVDSIVELEEFDSEGNYVGVEANLADHMTKGALKVDKSKNVATEIKQLISKSIIKTTFVNLNSIIDLESNYGISNMLTIDDVWGTLINVVNERQFDIEGVIEQLRELDTYKFKGLLKNFIDILEKDKNIQNSFYATINLSVIDRQSLQSFTPKSNRYTKLSVKQNNYNAFVSNVTFEDLLRTIAITNENTKGFSKLVNEEYFKEGKKGYKNYNTILNNIVNSERPENWLFNKAFKTLGIDSRIASADFYRTASKYLKSTIKVNENFKITTDVNIFYKQLDNAELNNAYNVYVKNYIDNTLRILQEIANIKKGSAKTSFRNKLSNKGKHSIRLLTETIKLHYYNRTNLSYYNVNGEMEFSPEYHSFLTELISVVNPIDNKINFAHAKDKLNDYLNDRLLDNNPFLYNINKSGGLFNYEGRNQDGTRKVVEINPEFISMFSAYSLGGVKNTTNGLSSEYSSIDGEFWNLISIASAIIGRYTIPSSDSPRSYGFVVGKYGSKDIPFDIDGKYAPLTNLAEQYGIIKNGKYRTIKDINEDSVFYVEREDLLTKDLIYEFKTYKEIVSDATDTTKLLNSLKDISHILYRTLNYTNPTSPDDNTINTDSKSKIHSINNKSEIYKKYTSNKKLDSIEEYFEFIQHIINIVYNVKLDVTKPDFMNILRDGKFIASIDNKDINLNNFAIYVNSFRVTSEKGKVKKLQNLVSEFTNRYTKFKEASEYSDISKLFEKSDGSLIARINRFRSFKTTTTLINAVYDEANAMRIAMEKMYTINYKNVEIENEKGEKEIKPLPIEFIPTQYSLDSIKKGTGLHRVTDYMKTLLDKNGNPTGRVFKFHRLTYVENGKVIDLFEYAKKIFDKNFKMIDFVDLVMSASDESHPMKDRLTDIQLRNEVHIASTKFNNLLYSFLDKVLTYQQDKVIKTASSAKEEIMQLRSDAPKYISGTHGDVNYNSSE